MDADQRSIRDAIARWHSATIAGDVDAVVELMSDDVVFLVAGNAPMRGRDAFAAGLRKVLESHRIESSGEVQEIDISGELAYCWAELDVTIIPKAGGSAMRRKGSALSIFRKDAGGQWRLSRDANLLPPPR
jgi:uncharacterized protein (TIGR02246 family)